MVEVVVVVVVREKLWSRGCTLIWRLHIAFSIKGEVATDLDAKLQ